MLRGVLSFKPTMDIPGACVSHSYLDFLVTLAFSRYSGLGSQSVTNVSLDLVRICVCPSTPIVGVHAKSRG